MNIEQLEKFTRSIRRRPVITTALLILLGMLTLAGVWASAFFGELGRKWASSEAMRTDHVVVGKWRNEYATIAFYGDGVASFGGSPLKWKAVDDETVRIEEGETITEFSVQQVNGEFVGTISGLEKLVPAFRKLK